MSQNARFPRTRPPPKAYTETQLNFLKSYLPEFERRSLGPIRGDAKKFALERAADFIARFGIPEETEPGEDTDARFREVCASLVTFWLLVKKDSRPGKRLLVWVNFLDSA
ncbi:hypothetical protein MVEN_00816800 [Mycena venus]|uniref:Uncharacterized protein n=1 Tax=Mycena venus TaxID=2733690 RepID=A0A8H6YGT0_9AGAR|nr:hypothetical protein MVEN_00816800 [Mycena venus]